MSEKSELTQNSMIRDAIRLWTHVPISIIDVRYKLICLKQPIKNYQLPTSMLIYVHGGMANVTLDTVLHFSKSFGIFHGGKGAKLTIEPVHEHIEAYMVLYKAEAPPFFRKDLYNSYNSHNPFIKHFGFLPENPIFYMEKFQKMYELWQREKVMDQFYTKILLYQLIHEIYIELERVAVHITEPDFVASVKRYLDEHYAEPLSIQTVSTLFPISASQLSRLFKKREKNSLQGYLNEKRLQAAKHFLLNSKATIKEIAEGCGFVNELNMIRMFKKNYAITPNDFRRKMIYNMRNNDIDNNSQRHYNEKELAKLAQFSGEEELSMFEHKRSKEILLAAAVSIMLLLSACTSSATPVTSSTPPLQANTDTKEMQAMSSGTRIVATSNGEVEVPSDPQRIVIQSMFAVGDILPFGKPIIGIDQYFKDFSNLDDWQIYWDKFHELGVWETSWDEAIGDTTFIALENVEGIVALDPDMIIARTDGMKETLMEQYNKIAPTIYYDSRNMTMEESMDFIGEVFGMPERAEELKKIYIEHVEKAKQQLSEAGLLDKKIVFVQGVEGKNPSIHGDKNRALIYEILGMSAPEIVESTFFASKNSNADGVGYSSNLSAELLPEYLADADIIAYTYFDETAETVKSQLLEDSLWSQLQAVQNGNVYYYSVNDTMMNYDYSSHLITLETFVNALLQLPIAEQ